MSKTRLFLKQKKMRKNTSHRISELTMLNATSPMEASLWTKLAKLTLNFKLKFTKRALTTLLLRRLIRRNTATNDVANFVKNIPRKFHKNRMKMRMMRTKLEDAVYQERKLRNLFASRYDYLMRRWGHNHFFRSRFNIILQEETRFVWMTGRERIRQKADHLAMRDHMAPAPEHSGGH